MQGKPPKGGGKERKTMENKNALYDRYTTHGGAFTAYGKFGWGVNYTPYSIRRRLSFLFYDVDAAKNRVK